MTRRKKRTQPKQGRGRRAMRAFRQDDVASQLERRLLMLGVACEHIVSHESRPQTKQRLARALRRERRAARAAEPGYDPLRHLVLVRLSRLMRGTTPATMDDVVGAAGAAPPAALPSKARTNA